VNVALIVAVYITMIRDVLLNWQTLVIALLSCILFFQMQKKTRQVENNPKSPLPFSSIFWKKEFFSIIFRNKKP